MRLLTFSDNNHKLMFDWNVYCHNYVSTAPEKSCKYHQMKDTGVVRNISWSRCHHKSRPWSPFICVNISGKYDKGDHNNDKGVTLGDQASDRYYLCWRWYHTILWGDSSCDTPINIMMMMILACGFLYYRSYHCHAQMLLLSNTCDKLILITLHVVMTEFTEFLLV